MDRNDWTQQLTELEALCHGHPELFVEAEEAMDKKLDAPSGPPKSPHADELRMKLEMLTQWHEKRAKALQAATIRLFVREHRARCC